MPERLIVALDVSSAHQARDLVAQVGTPAPLFKVGKQLFTAAGPELVRELVASGRRVFLDLKFHDIPNTVAAAVAEAAKLGVDMLTVHASGGTRMLVAAAAAAAQNALPASGAAKAPLVLAVTVLTSMSEEEMQETGVGGTIQTQVLRLASLAVRAGCGGIVASALEARELRRELGSGFAIVTPGVRPAGDDKGDQRRVVTPRQAIEAGATHIVVGRPITAAVNPAEAVERIRRELDAVPRA